MAIKKTNTKKTAVKKPRAKARASEVRSFHVAPVDRGFWSFGFTQQSLYWVIIGAAVLSVGIYVASLQVKINSLYDLVDANSVQSELNKQELQKLGEALRSNANKN